MPKGFYRVPDVQFDLQQMKGDIERNVRVEIVKAITANVDSQQALIKRLEELLTAGDESMKKQQIAQAELAGVQEQAVSKIK